MAFYAIVENGVVVNSIEWDGVAAWLPPSGSTLVRDTVGAGPGWTWDGTAFSPPIVADPPVVNSVPQKVPLWAAQAALKQAGKFDAVDAYVVTLKDTNPPVFFAWTMGNMADRGSAMIGALAGQFGLSSTDLDAIFVAANAISSAAG